MSRRDRVVEKVQDEATLDSRVRASASKVDKDPQLCSREQRDLLRPYENSHRREIFSDGVEVGAPHL